MRSLLAPLLLLAGPALAGPRVAVLQSDDLEAYTSPVPAFLDALGEPALVMNLHGREADAAAAVERMRREEPDAVFALGAKAAWTMAQHMPDTPTVYAAVLDPDRYGVGGSQITGIDATVAPGIFLSQLTGFLPDVARVGVLRGADGSDDSRLADMREAAGSLGLTLVVIEVDSPRQVRRSVLEVADQIDALWLQPERDVLDASTFRFLTAETRRRGMPLLVETENMVSAGALFAVVPDPSGVGRQAATMIERILEGAAPGVLPVEVPEHTQVVFSTRAARLAEVEVDPLLLDFVDVVVE